MKMKNCIFLLVSLVILLFTSSTPATAAKKRVWGATTVTSPVKGGPFSVSARFSGWKQYLNVSFRGVAGTSGVTYELIYSSNGIDQGVGGRVSANEGNVTRQIFLGTCSHNKVCTSHKNVSNVRLKVTYQTTSGQSVTKNYKVKY